MMEGRHEENQQLQYLGNSVTDRHKIGQGDATALNRPCACLLYTSPSPRDS